MSHDLQDKELLSPLPIPVAIVGGKYDLFQDFDPEKKKMISKTLRFLAHTNGATLLVIWSLQPSLLSLFLSHSCSCFVLSSFCFYFSCLLQLLFFLILIPILIPVLFSVFLHSPHSCPDLSNAHPCLCVLHSISA